MKSFAFRLSPNEHQLLNHDWVNF